MLKKVKYPLYGRVYKTNRIFQLTMLYFKSKKLMHMYEDCSAYILHNFKISLFQIQMMTNFKGTMKITPSKMDNKQVSGRCTFKLLLIATKNMLKLKIVSELE